MPEAHQRAVWPPGLTRVPYWVYQDRDVLESEQTRLFQGPVWNYLCLEAEIPAAGDWRTTGIGRMPVVVVRTETGGIAAFENRCAHRGALICLDAAGRGANDFTCVYHAWRYDLTGVPQSVAFGHGINGHGGMPDSFRVQDHGPRRLRVATFCGLVFGTLDPTLAPFEDWIGPEIAALRRANIYERQTYRHILGLPLVRAVQGTIIQTETPFLVVHTLRDGKMDLFAAGRYLDRIRTEPCWQFAERIAVCDSSRFDTLLALPL